MECFTWIPHFWEQLFGIIRSPFVRNLSQKNQVVATIPDDVIPNILSRLPADQAFECRKVCKTWQALISTPDFIDMNLKRSTSILIIRHDNGNNWKKCIYFFVDEHAEKNRMFKRMDCQPGHVIWNICPHIDSSCNGLLMFRGGYGCPYYFICNPVTQEHHMVSLPYSMVETCGFFYNPFRGEYCILVFQPWVRGHLHQFFIYGTSPQVKWRQLGDFKLAPKNHFAPSIVNGALHWMTHRKSYGESIGFPCNEAIFIFNMKDENFSYRPHPGLKCPYNCRRRNNIHDLQMCLLEIDQKLSFFHIYPDFIDIWVLRDYADWIWDKSFKVKLNFARNIFDDFKRTILGDDGGLAYNAFDIVDIQNDELLLIIKDRLALRYHIKQHTIRKVCLPIWLNLSFKPFTRPITYKKSLASFSNL